MRVGVVGLGAMGSRIATRLLEVGEEVVVWNRSAERVAPVAARGALPASTPAEAAARADVLITMVADPRALRAVSEGRDGIAAAAGPSLLVIEMSTVGPDAVDALRKILPQATRLVDAPVLGSLREAESGSLTIFAGGDAPHIELALPLLAELGSVVHVGPLRSGAAAKLVANAAVLGTLTLLGETIALGRRLGLSPGALWDVLAATPLAGQADRRRAAVDAGDYPRRFALSLARKDADLIRRAARSAGAELPLIDGARSWLADAEAAGLGEQDYSVVLARILGQEGGQRRAARQARGSEWPRAYDGLIVDLDGVVWLGDHPIKGAAEGVARLRRRGIRLLFLTNDPSCSRAEQSARLTAIGIPAGPEEVITSAAATARFLAGRADLGAGATAFVVGSAAFQQEIADAGFELVPISEAQRAHVVVVGGHEGFDFAELRAATQSVANGAQLVAAGRDAVVPTRDGLEPATGAILAAVETASGVTATVVGKPEPFMFELAREALGDCERVAAVGDNLASDVVGAKRAGLDAILVLSGASTERDLEGAEYQPDLVLSSLAALAAAIEKHEGRRAAFKTGKAR